MNRHFDVGVVGAGPAGSGLAACLAREGARVALLEKCVFPREKLCGGFVSPEALTILHRIGIRSSPPAGRFAAIRSFALTTPKGRRARSDLPGTADSPELRAGPPAAPEVLAWGISRADLDEWLAGEATAAGAELFESAMVEDVSRTKNGAWEIVARRGGRAWGEQAGTGQPLRLTARLLVLCEGRRGTLARRIGRAFGPGPQVGAETWNFIHAWTARESPRIGFQSLLEAPAASPGTVELHFFRGGYLGLQPVGGGLVNACGLMEAPAAPGDVGFDRLLERARATNPHCAARLDGARRVGEWYAVGGLRFGPGPPALGEVFLAGDACGTIEPFTGEGITMALATGLALAHCLGPVLEGRREVSEAVRHWRNAWRRAFLPRLRLCRLLASAARRPLLVESAAALMARRESLARRLISLTRTSPDSLSETG